MAGLKSFKGALTQLYGKALAALEPPTLLPTACPPALAPLRHPSCCRYLFCTADEQRARVKGIKAQSLVNKARNEAKREMEEAHSDAPLHLLRLDGRSSTLFRNDAQAYAQQRVGLFVPWLGWVRPAS